MQQWKLVSGLAALVAAGVLGSALPGSAQKGKKAPDSTLGYVDLSQVTDQVKQTKEWQVMVDKFETRKTQYRNELMELSKVRFLSAAETEELKNLRAKPMPSDKETARTRELGTKSDQLEGEFKSLSGVEKPTPDQTKRLQDLSKIRESGIDNIKNAGEERTKQLQDMEVQMLDDLQKQILGVVKQVAEGKDITLVIDRQAILYGGVDLTPDVIKKLGGDPKK